MLEVGMVIYRESLGEFCELLEEHAGGFICRVFEVDEAGNEITIDESCLLTLADLKR